jgi:hypothetical protein
MDSEQFAQIMSGITQINTQQADLRRELLGNGQPGRIQILESEMEKVKTTAADLQKEAAGLRWRLGTMSAAAGAALSVGIQWALKHILHQ